MASKHLERLATDLNWIRHGENFAGEAQQCLFTIGEEDGFLSIFFYIPDLDEDALVSIDRYLKQNKKRLNILDHAYTDDYLLITLKKTLIPISDDKLANLLLIISNMAREGQGDLNRKCPVCQKQAEREDRDFYLDLYSYVHPSCLNQLNLGHEGTDVDADPLYNDENQEVDTMSETNHEEQLAFLQDLIRIPSVKGEAEENAPFGIETVRALDRFLEQAKADGFRTKSVDNYCGWLEFGPEDAPAMIAGVAHLDVVPVGDWTDAFEPIVTDDRIIGRGSSDDKGPAVSTYYALKALKDSGYEPTHRLRLVLGLDEESGSACMKRYLETEEVPVAGFTPDADFPVIHAEKGMFRFDVDMSWPKDETSPLRLIKAEAGSVANVIPGSARYTLVDSNGQESSKTVEGIMGHASMPELAKNAISLAIRDAAYRLEEAGVTHPFVKMYQDLFALDYDGDHMGIKLSDDVSGPLTLNIGVIKLEETHVHLICDIRYPVTADFDTIIKTIEDNLAKHGATFHLRSHSVPLFLPKDHPLISTLTGVYNKVTDSDAQAIAIGGGTYARSIPNIVAFGPGFPGEEGLAHQYGEYMRLDSFFRSQEIYREAFRELDQVYANK